MGDSPGIHEKLLGVPPASTGPRIMRVAYCKRLESSFPVLGPTRNVGKRRLAPSLTCASGFRELDAALAVTIFRQF